MENTLPLFGFLKRKASAASRAAADQEDFEVREACRRVFGSNLNILLQDREIVD